MKTRRAPAADRSKAPAKKHAGATDVSVPQSRDGTGKAPGLLAWWHVCVAIAVSLFIAFEVYGPALHGEFVFDDEYLPFNIPEVARAPLQAWLGVRPVLMMSYWLNYQIGGLQPYGYHAINVALHAFNAVLVWLIVRRMLTFVAETGLRREILAGGAGALFLLHPAQTEAVAYVAGRSETLSVFFFLMAFALFICRSGTAISTARTVGVLVLFGIACATKEHTTVLPVLLLLADYLFVTPFRFEAIRKNVRLYLTIAVFGALGVVAVIRVLSTADSAGFRIQDFTWYQYLFTQFRVIWTYLRLFVLPVNLNADYHYTISRTILDEGAVFWLAGLLALAVLAWRYRRTYPLAVFGFFGFLVLLAPTSSVVPIRDVIAERRLYLPFFCLLLIAVDLLRRTHLPATALTVGLAGVTIAAGAMTHNRAELWGDKIALWTDTTRKSPENTRALFQLAFAQYSNGECIESARNFEKLAGMQNPDERLLVDWALALDCANRPDEAVEKLRQAARVSPSALPYSQIGMIYGKRGRSEEALTALAQAEQLDPNFVMTYVYRGNVLLGRGNAAEAAAQYERALALDPNNDGARKGLASARRSVVSR